MKYASKRGLLRIIFKNRLLFQSKSGILYPTERVGYNRHVSPACSSRRCPHIGGRALLDKLLFSSFTFLSFTLPARKGKKRRPNLHGPPLFIAFFLRCFVFINALIKSRLKHWRTFICQSQTGFNQSFLISGCCHLNLQMHGAHHRKNRAYPARTQARYRPALQPAPRLLGCCQPLPPRRPAR